MALLSIIVPVYNKELYIDSCIESILKQSLTDFQLILINDGSTDSSGIKCDYYGKLNKNIIVIHQQNKGVSAARNTGLEIATGTYIGFVDCDDTLDHDMYEVLLNSIEEFKADIAICGVRKIFPTKVEFYYGTNEIKSYNKNEAISALLKKGFSRSVYDKLYKAEIAKSAKFEGSMNEDTFYNFQVLNNTQKVVYNDTLKYNYIVRNNSASMSMFNQKYMDTLYLSKKILEICKNKTPELVDEAKYFDFIANLSLINLIILSNKRLFMHEYKQVINNLNGYSNYVNKSLVNLKHKCAYKLIRLSLPLYETLFKLYCRVATPDVSKKN